MARRRVEALNFRPVRPDRDVIEAMRARVNPHLRATVMNRLNAILLALACALGATRALAQDAATPASSSAAPPQKAASVQDQTPPGTPRAEAKTGANVASAPATAEPKPAAVVDGANTRNIRFQFDDI